MPHFPQKGCTNPKEVMKMLINGTEDLRVQKTIDAIQKTFEDMICEMDYEKITVKELCERARINKKTFYRYYIAAPDADFGLVWYGSSRHGCEGRIGDYLRYIAAHKLSLYLRCEVPVIVGKGTAMAEFVEREGIGITVDSLDNIEGLLGKLSPEQYMQMHGAAATIPTPPMHGYRVRAPPLRS